MSHYRMFTKNQIKEIANKEIADDKASEIKRITVTEDMWSDTDDMYILRIDEGNYIIDIPNNLVHDEAEIYVAFKNEEKAMLLTSRNMSRGLETFISTFSSGFNTDSEFYISFAPEPISYSLSYHNHVVMLSFGIEEL